MKKAVILTIKNLVVKFKMHNKILTTIRNVSFDVYAGETLAIVGESGSGKSVLTKVLTTMIDKNGWVSQGQVVYYPVATNINDELTYFKKPVHLLDFHRILLDKKLKKAVIKQNNKTIKSKKQQIKLLETLTKATIKTKKAILNTKINNLSQKIAFKSEQQPAIMVKLATLEAQKARINEYYQVISNGEKKAKMITILTTEIQELLQENQKLRHLSIYEKLMINKNIKILTAFYERNEMPNQQEINKIMNYFTKKQYQDGVGYRINKFNCKMLENVKDIPGFTSLLTEWNMNKSFTFVNKRKAKYHLTKLRGHTIATIFQDPMTSLNPLLSVGFQISETLQKNQNMNKVEAKKAAIALLEKVGIANAAKRYHDIPGMYSGGMRQRVVIAIALACKPQILICDEPTTALDVTIQAQIIDLIKTLQKEYQFTIIFITHDLGLVANIADRIAVLYAGQIIEHGLVNEVFFNSQHPYTWALLSSLPQFSEKNTELYSIPGNPISLDQTIYGDPFASRNKFALTIDYQYEPPFFQVSPTHYAKTWLLDPRAPKGLRPKQLENIKNLGSEQKNE